jgi:DNA-binding transcriptional MerR regulator
MELISSKEAAEILGIGMRQLSKLASEGYIFPQQKKGDRRSNYYDPNEIAAFAQLRKEGVNLVKLAAQVQRTDIRSRRTERLQQHLFSVIGADVPLLKLDRESVIAMHLKVQDALELPVFTQNEVLEWAKTFYSMGEEYFETVGSIIETDDPWKPYTDLAKKIALMAPFREMEADVEVKAVYNYLKIATRFMRQAAFFYVRARYGERSAYRTFPESTGDAHEDILALAVMDYAKRTI